jgi:hypothetical protein
MSAVKHQTGVACPQQVVFWPYTWTVPGQYESLNAFVCLLAGAAQSLKHVGSHQGRYEQGMYASIVKITEIMGDPPPK